MTSLPADDPNALGFLTVVEVPGQGFIGGLLVLNPLARPLEFHCTAPVKPNRAQEILYGPTLAPYLYGEQIGQALLRAAQIRPAALFANQPEALAVASCVDMPVCLVMAGDDAEEDVVHRGAARSGTNERPQHPGHPRDVAIRRVDPAERYRPAGRWPTGA